jgi:hypothetical protein
MKTLIKSYLPIFPGFNDTSFDADVDSNIEDGKTYEDYDWKFEEYKTEMAQASVNAIQRTLRENGFNIDIIFEDVYSPKYYNFSTDVINVTYVFKSGTIKLIKQYINDNIDSWNTYIKDNFSSYDGFMSSYTNDGAEWYKEHVNLKALKADTTIAGVIFDFILKEVIDFNSYDLRISTECENVYIWDDLIKFELYELSESSHQKAIKAYRNITDKHEAPEIEIVDLIYSADIKYDYSGNAYNIPELVVDVIDPAQLNLFE